MSRIPRMARRAVVSVAIVGGGIAVSALPASAHVEIGEGEVAPGSEATLTFGIPHGCEESPTTKIRIQLPESIVSATPTLNANWDISLVTEKLDTPLDVGEGETVSERTTEVDFTAKTPLPIGFRDDLRISVDIPIEAAGTRLTFPTIQECVEGTTEWTQVPADGQDPEELAHPAPSVAVLAEVDTVTTIPAPPDDSAAIADGGADDAAGGTADDGADDGNGLAVAGLIAGVAGMALGGGALATARKQRAS